MKAFLGKQSSCGQISWSLMLMLGNVMWLWAKSDFYTMLTYDDGFFSYATYENEEKSCLISTDNKTQMIRLETESDYWICLHLYSACYPWCQLDTQKNTKWRHIAVRPSVFLSVIFKFITVEFRLALAMKVKNKGQGSW